MCIICIDISAFLLRKKRSLKKEEKASEIEYVDCISKFPTKLQKKG